MPKKVRAKEDLNSVKAIVRNMWVFFGYSIRKIVDEFNSEEEYVKKYGTVSYSSVQQYVLEIRRELETWLDEDVLEKYSGEFIRKQHIIDEQIDKLQKAQKLLDQSDPKQLELYLKFERAIHEMHMNQIKMMSEIELVLRIKKLNKDRRLKNETLVLVDDDGQPIKKENEVGFKRGYILGDKSDK